MPADTQRATQAHPMALVPSQVSQGCRLSMDWALAIPSLVLASYLLKKLYLVVVRMACSQDCDETLRRTWLKTLAIHLSVRHESVFFSTGNEALTKVMREEQRERYHCCGSCIGMTQRSSTDMRPRSAIKSPRSPKV